MSASTLQRTVSVSGMLAWRALILVRRMPAVFIPSLIMPLFILVATSGAFHGISAAPIGTSSYLAFTLPFATIMGAGFAGINAGMTLARDIEGGFVDRLIASPAPRISLVAGPFTAAAMRSIFTTTIVLVAGGVGGLTPPGVVGTIVIYFLAAGFAMATACWSMGVALRARTVQSAPMMQLVVFIMVFTSVAYAPRDLQTGWLRTVSDWNPVTRILEASRGAEFESLAWAAFWPALVSLGVLMGIFGAFALHGLARLGND
jgi:ABC-2 type transport system permease protein